jgi:hypothetical protein
MDKIRFFVGINFRDLAKNDKFVDLHIRIRGFCICTQNKIPGLYIFNIISFIG